MTLDLSNNKIGRMYSQSLIGLSNLKTLNLANNNIQTVTQILDVVPTLFQLNLGSNRIRVIHAKTFYKNVHMHYLDLRYNNLVRIHPDAFKHQKYLRYLFLNNNPLASLPALNMGSPNLQLIDFSHCQLKKVPQGVPPSVSDLRLGHNKIIEIRKRDLENITRLRMLTLNNNKINRVAFMAFSKLKNLQEIWLRDNNLIYIPRGLPDNLKKLYMDSNKVVEIQRAQFANTSQLEYFTVEKNRVQTIEAGSLSRLRFLKYLNLQGNGISTITKGMFDNVRNLTTLTLSNNPINKIETGAFKNLENLTSLYMSYIPPSDDFSLEDNFLPEMPKLEKLGLMGSQSLALQLLQIIDDTPVMHHLTEVDLTFNDIQTLPPSLQRVFPKVQALSIDGNILNCDNRLLWLARWMKASDVKFFAYEEPQCEEPEKNKGKLLKDVPESDYVEVKQELPPPPPVQEAERRTVEVPEKTEEPVQKLKVVQVEKVEKINHRRKGLNPAHRVANPQTQAAAATTTTTAPVTSKVEATTTKAPQRVGRRQRVSKKQGSQQKRKASEEQKAKED
ncbi:leucine-rich repeat-containing protein egg-6-like [Haliotis rubra]|uniref:leucine-rich repeat-containing protein egg-6-like n=1 Tax=Haliotis rubra TaxID=36100 RepID=UPI001EE5187B|nr:leucine-rich repeat-containing protein egg-6-like [Haliotis rubra]